MLHLNNIVIGLVLIVISLAGCNNEQAEEKSIEKQKPAPQAVDSSKLKLRDMEGFVVYSVQIAAYLNEPPQNDFINVPDLYGVQYKDGIIRYYSGSFQRYKHALSARDTLANQGFDDAFLVMFKDGQHFSLNPNEQYELQEEIINSGYMGEILADGKAFDDRIQENSGSRFNGLIKFSVMLGAYKGGAPDGVKEALLQMENFEKVKTPQGIYRYTTGLFDDYQQAEKYQAYLTEQGFQKTKIVGKYNGKLLTAQEAIELLKSG